MADCKTIKNIRLRIWKKRMCCKFIFNSNFIRNQYVWWNKNIFIQMCIAFYFCQFYWEKIYTFTNTLYTKLLMLHLEITELRSINQRRTETSNSILRIMHQSRPRYRQLHPPRGLSKTDVHPSPHSPLSLYGQRFVPCHYRICQWQRWIRRKKPRKERVKSEPSQRSQMLARRHSPVAGYSKRLIGRKLLLHLSYSRRSTIRLTES